ncbi:MAG: sugar ABC transporter ATP-binding protein [Myxococcota bacterium]
MTERRDSPLLAAEGLVKRFPGVLALGGVSFDLRPGEVHALCGENGAGKSTLIKVLSGVHPHGSYEGRVRVRGAEASFRSVRDAERAGIGVIHQELALVGEMSVAENLFLGAEPRRHGLIDGLAMHRSARGLLARVGLEVDPGAPVGTLGVGEQQLVEIARALGKRTDVLILDEPTAALAEREVDVLVEVMGELRDAGIACIFISHRLQEVFRSADRITVLRDGHSVGTFDAADTDRDEVIRHMVGREIAELYPRRRGETGPVLLRVSGLSVGDRAGGAPRLHGLDLQVHAGEVLGIGGLMGAGRTELLMHLFGAWGLRLGGEVHLDKAPLEGPPRESIRRGMALVTEDRKRSGLVLEQTVGFNLSLANLPSLSIGPFVDALHEVRGNRAMVDALGIRAAGLETPVRTLSGGNQQKVVLGKALMPEPRVVLLDEPTRGVDVGAKTEVYELINRMTGDDKAVVLVSSELPELMGMSDRILMLHEGTVGGVFSREEATQERLMAAAMGARADAGPASPSHRAGDGR